MEIKRNSSFVPVNVFRDNYDDVAEDFLRHYGYEQAVVNPMPVPIFEIARKRMSLEVITTQQLSVNRDILGTIAFEEGAVEVYDPGAETCISFGVKRGSVLIDRAINHEGRENNTMAHECVHWFLHRYYFDHLRKQSTDADIAFRCPIRGISDADDFTRDEERMEKQARGIAPRILMPKMAANKKIDELLSAFADRDNSPNKIAVMTAVIDELAVFFHVSKQSAKYRMVELGKLGHQDALEIYGHYDYYDNSGIAWDFSTRPLTVKTTDRPLTRHITLEESFYEFTRSAAFREILQDGLFRFVEEAFVINDPKYIGRDENGDPRLTDYAIEHQQECTLLFEYAVNLSYGVTRNQQAASSGFLARIETEYKKLPRYVSNVNNDGVSDIAKALEAVKVNFDRFANERRALTPVADFWDRARQIMKAKRISLRTFKERSGLNDAAVSRLKLKKTAITLQVAIAVSFGLDLDLGDAEKLLALAKLALNDDEECLAYKFVLMNFKDCPLFEKNTILKKIGVKPIGTASKDE
jgi:Zn-dependent peptidase ImmA (M78 family)/transcriptional regulator with XRE-family HTH domain